MGGVNSGRRPSEETIVRRMSQPQQPVGSTGNTADDQLFLPNYSGLKGTKIDGNFQITGNLLLGSLTTSNISTNDIFCQTIDINDYIFVHSLTYPGGTFRVDGDIVTLGDVDGDVNDTFIVVNDAGHLIQQWADDWQVLSDDAIITSANGIILDGGVNIQQNMNMTFPGGTTSAALFVESDYDFVSGPNHFIRFGSDAGSAYYGMPLTLYWDNSNNSFGFTDGRSDAIQYLNFKAANITSGTYTPSLTNAANLAASTAYACQYIRVGDNVTVSGKVDVDPTLAATSTRLGISLPITTNLGAQENCAGTAFASGIAGQGAAIRGDAANDRAEMVWVSADVTNQPMYFTFTYQII